MLVLVVVLGWGCGNSLKRFPNLGPAGHKFCEKWLGEMTHCGVGSVVK